MAYPTTNAGKELAAINQLLASVGQAPVTTKDTSNPDVSIAEETFLYVNREVQAEGWMFNTDKYVEKAPDDNKWILIPQGVTGTDVLSMDLHAEYDDTKEAIIRVDVNDSLPKLYDKINHTFEWDDTVRVDITYLYPWSDVPVPVQDFIVARAAAVLSMRIVGDPNQYRMLQEREAYARSIALEYECNQGDYTIFGHPRGEKYYNSYQPYQALNR